MVWQRTTVYGNQMTMWMRKFTSWRLVVVLCLVGQAACAPRLAPATPAGVQLSPGRYLTAYYRAPDFTPAQTTYVLRPFQVEMARGVAADTFQALFMEELTQAWRANGLKLSEVGDTGVDGVVQFVQVRGAAYRFIRGRIDTDLVVSGAITRGGGTLFACQDLITVSSPVNPGPPAPKEDELLLRQAARTFAGHLLNEMLLYWPPAEGK
jgi:hypothetical protein